MKGWGVLTVCGMDGLDTLVRDKGARGVNLLQRAQTLSDMPSIMVQSVLSQA